MKKISRKIAVLGGGSFGTAIANMLALNGHQVHLWLRDKTRAKMININHLNSQYFPDLLLDESLKATTAIDVALESAELVFMAVPSHSCRSVSRLLGKHLKDKNVFIISTNKGIENPSFKLMSEVIHCELPHNPVGVMSGPNLAKEIVARQISATVIASKNEALISTAQDVLHSSYFRAYSSTDVLGVELAGALKNIYAVLSGMAAALGVGQNTIGLILTRSLAEMSRFAIQLGANPMTFLGLSGVGDLVVTCNSPLSRNYQVGYTLGQGKDIDDALGGVNQVVEGVNTLQIVKKKADELSVYMPLVDALYCVLYEKQSLGEVISQMMMREQNADVDALL